LQKKLAKIIATGSYLPEKILTNFDLEKIVETSDEWITSRTGILERRIAAENEFTSCMGAKAAKRAIESSNINKDQIDCIIVATLTPDYIFPSTACLIQKKIDLNKCASFDMQAACSGYIYALSIAKALVENNTYKNILIVASEKLSAITNYKDRSTCVIFGDGASAAIISKDFPGLEIKSISLGADGEHSNLLHMPAGGSANPASSKTLENDMHFIHMAGNEVFKHAVRKMESSCKTCLENANLQEKDVSFLIPHQANKRIIDALAKRFPHLPNEKILQNGIKKYGNTSASSIGIALDELLKETTLKNNENILLTAFGAGFTWGSSLLTQNNQTT
jgi:3-oxoacyl-[acyl-carrier-protein] synthase III